MNNRPASKLQIKMFFALLTDLGQDLEKAKEKAKQKFDLESFTAITSPQIGELIDLLKEKHRELNKPHEHRFICECGKSLVVQE